VAILFATRFMQFTSGVFLCIRCSGIHRGMGTHISKVKSIDLDAWTPEQMEVYTQHLLTSFAFMINAPTRPSKNGETALRTYTGKLISSLGTFHPISESIHPVVTGKTI
jgi:hypothetical protein